MHRSRVVIALAMLVSAKEARADDAPPIDYQAPLTCPAEATFRARLDVRLRAAPKSARVRALAVRITSEDSAFRGELRVRDADDAESVRTVSAATCDELVDALAFLAALSMGIVVTREPPATPPPVAPAPTLRREAPHAHAAFAFGGAAVTSALVGPRVGFGPEAFIEVRRETPALFAPAVRLSGRYVEGATFAAGGGAAKLTLTTARLDACPIRFVPANRLWVAPCLGLDAGTIRAEASAIAAARGATEAFVSANFVARAEWAPVVQWLALDAEVGGEIPILLYDFRFLPNADVSRVPVVGAVARLGLAVRFQ